MFNLAHTVSRSVLVEAPPEQVWEALVDEDSLGEWLADEVELEPREGGEVLCRYGDGSQRRGRVELVEEAERLAFHWRREGHEPSRVEFVLEAVAAGTFVTVTESGPLTPGPTLALSWGRSLGRLRFATGRLVLA